LAVRQPSSAQAAKQVGDRRRLAERARAELNPGGQHQRSQQAQLCPEYFNDAIALLERAVCGEERHQRVRDGRGKARQHTRRHVKKRPNQ